MAEIFEASETVYTFRFGTSKKIIQLSQQQLNHFPYLTALVAHTDDFSTAKNNNDEYVLKYPIRYCWFMAIYRSIITEQPSALFTELSQEANVFGMLQLYDYLCINPLPVPLLKEKKLARSNSINTNNENKYIKYRRANLSEARNMATQFIIAISKNEYNLSDLETINNIFSLIMIIFSNSNVFHSRFHHHTLTIVKKYCFSLFSDAQQHQLLAIQQITQNDSLYSLTYLNDDDQPLPESFKNAFAWKGTYVSKEEDETVLLPNYRSIILIGRTRTGKSSLINCLRGWIEQPLSVSNNDNIWSPVSLSSINVRHPIHINLSHEKQAVYMNEFKQNQRKNEEAQSARAGRFNTLPKRPAIDKFKHRSGPKAQKHR
ncbi:unnamed protein product [Rotaria sp. Silwood1]|nr:unnamed protein product [Rotaria sp. Silwood1]